jgi:hypothetical protein
MMGKRNDYDRLSAALLRQGAEHVSDIGIVQITDDDEVGGAVRIEAWSVNGHGLIIAHHLRSHSIGFYDFLGRDGQPIDFDLAYVQHNGPRWRAGEESEPVPGPTVDRVLHVKLNPNWQHIEPYRWLAHFSDTPGTHYHGPTASAACMQAIRHNAHLVEGGFRMAETVEQACGNESNALAGDYDATVKTS